MIDFTTRPGYVVFHNRHDGTANHFYVYLLLDDKYEVFYVGKGRGTRAKSHFKRAASCDNSPIPKEIRSCAERGNPAGIRYIYVGEYEQEAFICEAYAILFYQRTGCKLLNEQAGTLRRDSLHPRRSLQYASDATWQRKYIKTCEDAVAEYKARGGSAVAS